MAGPGPPLPCLQATAHSACHVGVAAMRKTQERVSFCCQPQENHVGTTVTLESAPMGLRHSTQVLAQNLSKHFRQQWWPSFSTYFFPCRGSLQ